MAVYTQDLSCYFSSASVRGRSAARVFFKDLVNKVMKKEKNKAPHYAWFLTAKGTTHPSITDAPLIEPHLLAWTTGSSIDAREGVLQYVKIGQEFMRYLDDGHRVGILAEEVTHPTYNEDIRNEERKNKMSKDML